MMIRTKPFPLFLLAFLSALILSACSTAAGTTIPGGMMETGAPGNMMATQVGGVPVTGVELDEMFINMMVPHHQGAVAMAEIALARSQRQEIRAMAEAIIASQAEEIDQMKSWKQEWYGSSDTPDMSVMPMMSEMPGMGGAGHTMDMQADVDALESASEPFDLAFIDAMIPHHQSAVETAQVVLDTAVHQEIRDMAKQVIAEQQAEIVQMQDWRKLWFPDAAAP